jgi:hypothetical protein
MDGLHRFNSRLRDWYVETGKDPNLMCRANRAYEGRRFPATHHDGPVPQDSWGVPLNAMDMNPPLNRLARDGAVEKINVQALRGVLWRWAGDTEERTQSISGLEALLLLEVES